jgi:hypothetical protein
MIRHTKGWLLYGRTKGSVLIACTDTLNQQSTLTTTRSDPHGCAFRTLLRRSRFKKHLVPKVPHSRTDSGSEDRRIDGSARSGRTVAFDAAFVSATGVRLDAALMSTDQPDRSHGRRLPLMRRSSPQPEHAIVALLMYTAASCCKGWLYHS